MPFVPFIFGNRRLKVSVVRWAHIRMILNLIETLIDQNRFCCPVSLRCARLFRSLGVALPFHIAQSGIVENDCSYFIWIGPTVCSDGTPWGGRVGEICQEESVSARSLTVGWMNEIKLYPMTFFPLRRVCSLRLAAIKCDLREFNELKWGALQRLTAILKGITPPVYHPRRFCFMRLLCRLVALKEALHQVSW